jgi:hypothetical protein
MSTTSNTSAHEFPPTISIQGIVFQVDQETGTFKVYNYRNIWTPVTLVKKSPPEPSFTSDGIMCPPKMNRQMCGGGELVDVVTDCRNYTLVGDCFTKMKVYIDGRPSVNMFIEEYEFSKTLLERQSKN